MSDGSNPSEQSPSGNRKSRKNVFPNLGNRGMSSKHPNHKRTDKINRSRPATTNDRSRKFLLTVSNPTQSTTSKLTDVVTSEDILIEEKTNTLTRKTLISRPLKKSKGELNENGSPKNEHLKYVEGTPKKRKSGSVSRISPIRTEPTQASNVVHWTNKFTETHVHIGSPIMGITSSNKHGNFVTSGVDGYIRTHDIKSGAILDNVLVYPAVDNRAKFQAAMTRDGDFVVASGDAVTLWSDQARLLNEYGNVKFCFCKQLYLDDDGIIAVSDTDQNCAVLMSQDGNWFHKFGSKGTAKGEFICPTGITIMSNGDVVVADWSHRLQVFDRLGRFKFQFGSKGNGNGQFDLPYGLTRDGHDNIIVADWWNNRVSAFDKEGTFIKHLITAVDGIKMPAYVCVPQYGRCLILSEFGHSVAKIFTFRAA
ncbi:uncharacterized protein LOC100186233 isoform X1 [Ciona intestinalis]